MYPEDSVQNMIEEWWVEDHTFEYHRGRLINVFLPLMGQIPKKLAVTGDPEGTDHSHADFTIEPLRIKEAHKKPAIPVAAIPTFENEVNVIYRAKKRPALILCEGGENTDEQLTLGKPKWQTAQTVLVAPYDECGSTDFAPEFITRVRHCMYPQLMWEKLPTESRTTESVLRLDHIQPVGQHHHTIELTAYRLSEDALIILDEWLRWLISRDFRADSLLFFFKEEMKKI